MAWWNGPNNTALANIAEAAAAGLPFLGETTTTTTTTTPPPLSAETQGFGDIWQQYAAQKECGHYTWVNGSEKNGSRSGKFHDTFELNATCQLWSEAILSLVVAAFGLVGNLTSIWVLSVPEMRCTAFNRLLLALALVDIMFIGPGVIIYVFESFHFNADWYNYLFPVFLYPFAEIAQCSSIYMTVAIAVERFIGLCRPFRRLSSRPCPAKAYILPALGISVLLNIPKFFEAETSVSYEINASGENITNTRIGISDIRIHPSYITYYTMWTRLLATGIFPLAMLAILNTKIYLALRRSKHQLRSMAIRSALPMAILGKPATPPSQIDLRIDSSNWSQNGHHVNGINGGVTTPLNPQSATVSATPPKSQRPPHPMNRSASEAVVQSQNGHQVNCINGGVTTPLNPQLSATPLKCPPHLPHPMNRSVSEAVVQSKRLIKVKEPIARSQSTAAATPLRGHTSNGHAHSNGNTQPANDLNLAPVLFGVVIVFAICHSLRVFINIYDFSVVDEIISCEKKGVGRVPPAWIGCSIYVSQLLLMVNSSVNFLVYCVAGSKFRSILYQQLSTLFKKFKREDTGLNGPSQPPASNGIQAALLQQPQKQPQLASFKQQTRRNPSGNRLLEAAAVTGRHPRIVEV